MKKLNQKLSIRAFFLVLFTGAFVVSLAKKDEKVSGAFQVPFISANHVYIDSPDIDLPYPIKNGSNNPNDNEGSNVDFEDPLNVNKEIIYNPETGQYEFKSTLGEEGLNYRDPYYMDVEEYRDYDFDKALDNYWKKQIEEDNMANTSGLAPIPFIDFSAFTFSVTIAVIISLLFMDDNIILAVFVPTPETEINCLNNSLSGISAKPYSV